MVTVTDETPFSFPEISIWLDERDYLRANDMIEEAARLVGDDPGRNEEYERGMAELIMRVMGWPVEHVDEIVSCIHETALVHKSQFETSLSNGGKPA